MCRCSLTDSNPVWCLDACKHIEFHFTQIDSGDPDRVFGLALKLRPDKSFSGQLLGMLTDIRIICYPDIKITIE